MADNTTNGTVPPPADIEMPDQPAPAPLANGTPQAAAPPPSLPELAPRTTTPSRPSPAPAPTIAPPEKPAAHGSPTRVYLNQNVTPHLLEGMKYLAAYEPEKPLKWLSEFLAKRSAELEGGS